MVPEAWGRRRLLAVLASVVTVAALLLTALGYAAWTAVGSIGEDGDDTVEVVAARTDDQPAEVAQGVEHRDAIAAAPMLTVPESAMHPSAPTEDDPPTIRIPAAATPGPATVLTGFPRTPQGAVGQLAQIDATVLQAMTLNAAREVYRSWALPGGSGAENWVITGSVEGFLAASGTNSNPDPSLTVTAEPAAAMVKGTDGPQWTVACVLFKVTGNYRSQSQVAFAHCERMQWTGGRWMIAPGRQPAAAPATWPGTDLATEAGWRTWITDDRNADGGY